MKSIEIDAVVKKAVEKIKDTYSRIYASCNVP